MKITFALVLAGLLAGCGRVSGSEEFPNAFCRDQMLHDPAVLEAQQELNSANPRTSEILPRLRNARRQAYENCAGAPVKRGGVQKVDS